MDPLSAATLSLGGLAEGRRVGLGPGGLALERPLEKRRDMAPITADSSALRGWTPPEAAAWAAAAASSYDSSGEMIDLLRNGPRAYATPQLAMAHPVSDATAL